MKLAKLLSIAALGLAMNVQAGLIIQSNYVNQAIPDGTPIGINNTISISTVDTWINDIAVDVTVSGSYNGDLYAYLVHGTDFAVLLNRVGRTTSDSFGYGDDGFTVRFVTDTLGGGTDIHLTSSGGGTQTGTWLVDGRNVNPANVLDTTLRTALLDQYLTDNPNGDWTIGFFDLAGGFQSTLVGWQLEIDAVPEPITWAVGIFGMVVGLANYGKIRRWVKA